MATDNQNNEVEGSVNEQMGRRSVLRRAGLVAAAGLGGAVAGGLLDGGAASAAQGDPVAMGEDNDAGVLQTSLTSAVSANPSKRGSTLRLTHTSSGAPLGIDAQDHDLWQPVNGIFTGGEIINLSTTDSNNDEVQSLFTMTGDNSTGLDNLAVVLTTATGTVFAPVGPTRLLDTRYSAYRGRIANPTCLDANHRVKAKNVLELDVSDLVFFAYAIHFNLTATSELGTGFLTAFGSQNSTGTPHVPNASNLNFHEQLSVANSGLSPLSDRLSLFIYASNTTHIVLDLQGWTLPDFSFLQNTSGSAAVRSQAVKQRSPASAIRAMPRKTARG